MGDDSTAKEPPPIGQPSAPELKTLFDSRTPFELVDRTDDERAFARIDGPRVFDHAHHGALRRLDREAPIAFQCHRGGRRQQAAKCFRCHGFRGLYNLRSRIDAWSVLVDPSVPRD